MVVQRLQNQIQINKISNNVRCLQLDQESDVYSKKIKSTTRVRLSRLINNQQKKIFNDVNQINKQSPYSLPPYWNDSYDI